MKFTLSWLRTHLKTEAPLDRITDTLTRIGLELEGVTDRGAALAAFRIARVIEAVPHPNADRLRVCTVDTGAGMATVVCGAPNARTGMTSVFAAPGSIIPATGAALRIGDIRGVKSAGMLLSAREMGLGDDHSGIMDLPDDAPVGQAYAAWAGLDDPVIEIAVTPNRGDAFSVRGIARDLAAAGIGQLLPWSPKPVPATFQGGPRWRIDWPAACPWILGRTIRNVRNGTSPAWLADRLTAIGLRPINTLVDITNFFTVDLGRPLHVFDIGKLTGDTLVLRAGAGETFRALNGRDVTVTPADCVIADAAGVQSLAGVVGGEATGCDADTTSVFVECALFDAVQVALTGRRHQIVSDARQRFERGIDPSLLPAATEAATRMILDLCGGEAGEIVQAGAEPAWQREATLRYARVADLGGLDIPPHGVVDALRLLGFTLGKRDATSFTVAVPPWRNDIAAPIVLDQAPSLDPARAAAAADGCAAIEAECDLIEEVLRLHGLDAVPPVSLPRPAPVPLPTLTPPQARAALARRTLAAQGLAECVTFSFMPAGTAALFGDVPADLRLANPIAADLDQLRPTPLATLAMAAVRNAARGYPDTGLFEIGPAFDTDAEAGQHLVAAGLRCGATPRSWIVPARPVDAMDAKADLFAALVALGVPMEALGVTPDAPARYHPGRSGTVRQGPKIVLGHFGEIHPRLRDALGLAAPACGFELELDALADPKRRRRAAPDLPAFQPLRRDFAFLVDRGVPAEAVLRAARGAERTLIAGVALFDRYEDEKLAGDRKSLGVEVTFQPRAHTLTDQEIEAASARVVAAVAKATGATLR
jgi:phenylalanyl-tRNA synthetase beta chain